MKSVFLLSAALCFLGVFGKYQPYRDARRALRQTQPHPSYAPPPQAVSYGQHKLRHVEQLPRQQAPPQAPPTFGQQVLRGANYPRAPPPPPPPPRGYRDWRSEAPRRRPNQRPAQSPTFNRTEQRYAA